METFSRFYIMSLTMIFGSLVAGSTPVGGGAVAFPVMVLFIKLSAEDGRDFSLMIQSVAGLTRFTFSILQFVSCFPALGGMTTRFSRVWLKPHDTLGICCIPGGHVLRQLPDSVCQATPRPFLAHHVDDHQRSSWADAGFGSCHQ